MSRPSTVQFVRELLHKKGIMLILFLVSWCKNLLLSGVTNLDGCPLFFNMSSPWNITVYFKPYSSTPDDQIAPKKKHNDPY